MLTFVINGESELVTAEQFRALIDVAVRLMKDAAEGTGVRFTIGGLHASAPQVDWLPQTVTVDAADHERQIERVEQRLDAGLAELEHDEGLPDWMTEATANALYQSSQWFEDSDTGITGVEFSSERGRRRLTRRTFRTLDRVLHEQTDAIGSVTGTLMTATLWHGHHVTVNDEATGRGVRCFVPANVLTAAAGLIGERVTASGRIRRDHLGRPIRINNATIEAVPTHRQVSVAEIAGAFHGVGPDSVEWLRQQRG